MATRLLEQQYIKAEAERQFRANQHTSSPVDLDKQIVEGEVRLQYARQYEIPYPRLEHKTQYKQWHPMPKQDYDKAPALQRNDASSKLAKAMQKRKQTASSGLAH
ncbi:MAG: hypothetical protein FRX49_02252 [Trebouxia sp. A1-2]|nr:MAG: hypothetical protein FRX49_02252 [Trebouxia sp. A1-2]